MEISQDDLVTLNHLRAAWTGGAAREQSRHALAAWPGRAEGHVAHWAFSRAADTLRWGARRRLRIGEGLAPGPDELVLLRMARALADRDWGSARQAAQWLLREDAAEAFAHALAPAACALYGKAAPRRRKAARA